MQPVKAYNKKELYKLDINLMKVKLLQTNSDHYINI